MTVWQAYHEKADNLRSRPQRSRFWERIVRTTEARAVLEVGCSVGLNLEHLVRLCPRVTGVDIHAPALEEARRRVADTPALVHLELADARALPFSASAFDLAFSSATLQHIADDASCEHAMRELARVSRSWILVMEFGASERTPVAWRGLAEGIVKRPWGTLLEAQSLTIVDRGYVDVPDGFYQLDWWLCRKGPAGPDR